MLRHALIAMSLLSTCLVLSSCVGSQSPILDGAEPDPHFSGAFLVFAHEDSGKCEHPQTQPAPQSPSSGGVYCEIGSLDVADGDGWKRLTTKVAAPPAMAGASIDLRLLGDGSRPSIAELRMRAPNGEGYLYGAVLPFSGDERLRVAMPIHCDAGAPSGILARDNSSCTVSAEALQQAAAEAKDPPAFHFVLVPVVDGRSVLTADAKPGERGSAEYEETRQRLLDSANAALDRMQADRDCLFYRGIADCQVHQGRAVLKMKHQDGFYLPDGTVLGNAEWPK